MAYTAEQIALANQIRATFVKNIRSLETALAGDVSGHVHVWPKFWIGVKFNKDVCHGVAIDLASVVRGNDHHHFTNGAGERTVLMSRRDALQGALKNANDVLDDFNQRTAAAQAA